VESSWYLQYLYLVAFVSSSLTTSKSGKGNSIQISKRNAYRKRRSVSKYNLQLEEKFFDFQPQNINSFPSDKNFWHQSCFKTQKYHRSFYKKLLFFCNDSQNRHKPNAGLPL
jgi:hypothetical protein